MPFELQEKIPSLPFSLYFSHSPSLFWKDSQSFLMKADVDRWIQQGRQRIPTEEQGRGVCIPVILLEGENEGGRVGYFAAEVHHSVTPCQTKISAWSPEKNKGFGWLLEWLINVLQGLCSATRLFINPTPQTHHLQYNRTAFCSRASRHQLERHFHCVALHSMDSMDMLFCYTLASQSVCVSVIWYHHAPVSAAGEEGVLVTLNS